MQLERTLEIYKPMQMQRTPERQRVYTVVDLEYLSASALYSGEYVFNSDGSLAGINGFNASLKDSGSSGSGFGKDLGLGLGYVFDTLKIDGCEIQMRLRADKGHKTGGYEEPHLNLEYFKKSKKSHF